MSLLLSLLAAIALLVWATHDVRCTVLELFGTRLRHLIGRGGAHPASAFVAGLGVTAVLQSSTATALIASAFVGQGLLGLPTALVLILGADVGTSLMAAVLSLDLSWLSPVLILVGAVVSVARHGRPAAKFGRLFVSLGLLLLALKLIQTATAAATQAPALLGALNALSGDLMLAVASGALLTIGMYSSLAVVLLTATLAGSGLEMQTAIGLVLGANVGSGLLAVLTTARSGAAARQLPLGNLIFKSCGAAVALVAWSVAPWSMAVGSSAPFTVVALHLSFNLAVAAAFVALARPVAALVQRMLPIPASASPIDSHRMSHLDQGALASVPLALSCATREVMHQADVVESMLSGLDRIIQHQDQILIERIRQMDDEVDALCSAIKRYLTGVPRDDLSAAEGRRWSAIVEFSIMLEQVADIIERIVLDVQDKTVRQGRRFSREGQAEICELHRRLVENMRLATAVFLRRDPLDARRLLDEKASFRNLERAFADRHLVRLADRHPDTIQTSGLHIDLLADLRRINSQLCSTGHAVHGPLQFGSHHP